jgi:hypothetical protein
MTDTSMAPPCPHCQTQNSYSDSHCSGCGVELPWAAARQQIAVTQAQDEARRDQLSQTGRGANMFLLFGVFGWLYHALTKKQ